MNITIAAIEHVNDLTNLAIEFRTHLNKMSPSREEFRAGIVALLDGQDAEFFIIHDEKSALHGYILQRYRFSMWANGVEARIEDSFVSPQRRQQGYGKALVEFAIKRAEEKTCTTMCLDTNENNTASTKIYTQFGFITRSKNWNDGQQIFFRRALKSSRGECIAP